MNSGRLGEQIAEKFFVQKGFVVVCRNYRKPWGEIDLIVESGKGLIFVEVKTVSAEKHSWARVYEVRRPEERVTLKKKERLQRVVQSYIHETKQADSEWRFGVCGVLIDLKRKCSKVSFLFEPL